MQSCVKHMNSSHYGDSSSQHECDRLSENDMGCCRKSALTRCSEAEQRCGGDGTAWEIHGFSHHTMAVQVRRKRGRLDLVTVL